MTLPLLKNDFYYIFLNRFHVMTSIGIHDHERNAGQELAISVTLVLHRTSKNDSIDEVVDYDFIINGIKKLILDRHFDLQETLCEEIIGMCMLKANIHGAIVQTEKTTIYANTDGVGCQLSHLDPACFI